MTLLFTLCISAVVALMVVSLFAPSTAGAERAMKERLDRRATLVADKAREAAAAVTPLPRPATAEEPAAGEAAA